MTFSFNRRSLITRLVGLSLLLLLFVQLAGFFVVRDSIARNARMQIAREFDTGEKVWLRLLDQNAEKLRQSAALLAADYGFRSAVSSDDLETIASALENNGQRIGAAMTALLDTSLRVRAISAQTPGADLSATLASLAPALAEPSQGGRIVLVDGQPYQLVMVPMRAPLVVGWVLMGFPVGAPLAEEMQRLLGVQLVLQVRRADGSLAAPVSTLPVQALQMLQGMKGEIRELEAGGSTLLVREIRLDAVGGETRVLLLRSMDDVVAPYRNLQLLLAIITVGGVLLFALGSGLMARRLTTPLRSLLFATQRLSRGDYSVPLEDVERHDEIGNLARSFDRMRVDIAAQQAEIRHLAYWDRLTGLPNRENFRDSVQQSIARSGVGGELAIITLDLDRFKHVNDVLGYAFGDQLLKTVAGKLADVLGEASGVVARLGGNEFALLLEPGNPAQATELAARVARCLEVPLAIAEQTVDLSAGIGIACWPADAQDVDTLLSRSEIAMYVAKRKLEGPLRYDPAYDSASTQTLSLLTELRRAVDQGELRLFLQPKVNLADGVTHAAEALVRWEHPQRGLVPPMQFIPFAEQTGYIRQLTLWMFEETARLLATPAAAGLRVSVNLSTRDLLDLELSARLGRLLEAHGVPASAFCLEITESAIMDDPQRAEAMLNRLSEQGFKLSIDDFGTGYSSLAYLKRLPVDELKIDKSFVMGMETDADDAIIVRSTIDLAHNLGLSVVAEGVETAAILERLRALGCDEVQGYHISRPMPASAFMEWLRK
ncbi:bifunctional diguanylate cyclase/phosphodiesterase [Curvibacter sp. PAE-UM]|uniref:putative bifunctional diguanylate cyclase/phosphodiesterase n=1 Tax=Curvibacter sp. PAE-UM TaxID=1714344 RepID=UPI00070C1AFA|nr:EAL domain-containing protein [Curvibacter sp. PAE-UM]KRI01680.1 diguanylate phosphodiesterase [Curvibacter sp. PAE-UM]